MYEIIHRGSAEQTTEPTFGLMLSYVVISAIILCISVYMICKSTWQDVEKIWGIQATELVITDIQMPEMDGVELIKVIRSIPKFNGVAIIANTQYGDPEQEEHILELGANDFVYKPSTPKIIKMRVKNVMRSKRG